MIAVLLANGFEEVEALAPVDMMRRAGLTVEMLGVGGESVTGSHGITVKVDGKIEELDMETVDAMVLPGGLPGTLNLEQSPAVQALLTHCVERGKLVAAICAAPSILAHRGLLENRVATAFPNFQKDLVEGGARLGEAYVCEDGNFITARGMGVATQFGLKLVERLVSPEKAADIQAGIQWEQ